jgi:hypothetical protein
MATIAGTRALQRSGHIEAAASFEERGHVPLPIFIVEVHRQKETGFVLHHCVGAHDKLMAAGVTTRKMPADHLVSDREKAAIGAIRAFDARLFADTRDPLICTGWRVASLSRLSAFETSGIDIIPAPEKRSKQFDLGGRRRLVCDCGAGGIRNGRFLRQRLRFVDITLDAHFHAATLI